MSRRSTAILAVVFVLVLMVLTWPYLSSSTQKDQFQVTSQPAQALQAALKTGRPIFLEFYAKW